MSARLKNYAEKAVEEVIDKILDQQGVCACEQCRLDIMALALNNLKPHYVVSEKGELYARVGKMDYQYAIDVVTEITTAAQKVKDRPRH
ncbi:MAG: late competence development ComFB family protein [Oscillospiraceae bacterium]|nr:late competence development ComFB family protein [Oscillospiraceae bacterium]